LRYSRHADDHLLGFIGPKVDAEQIKDQLATFLRDELKLEMSTEKTLITHARTRAARYLGYEIITQHADDKVTRGRRSINGPIALRVPPDVITAKCSSLLKTLAAKHQSTVSKIAARYKAKIDTPHGLRTCFEARVERTGKQRAGANYVKNRTRCACTRSGNSHSSDNPAQPSRRGQPSWPGNGERH